MYPDLDAQPTNLLSSMATSAVTQIPAKELASLGIAFKALRVHQLRYLSGEISTLRAKIDRELGYNNGLNIIR